MNNFHFYNEVARTRYTTTYKGREKFSINYVGIKRVQKTSKARVKTEVQMLHNVKCKNILQFYHWYETPNHYWIILEYCTGGTLEALIKQDKSVPESSIQFFGTDIMEALRHLHDMGVLLCNLKPSNIALDENDLLKITDLSLSRPIKDVSIRPNDHKRGSPYYMAPELFRPDGVYSVASDIWSFGCILYELLSGHVPFYSRSLKDLVVKITCNDPDPIDGASPALNDLLGRLLRKNPWERPTWKELVKHYFWRVQLPVIDMPPQPAFDELVQRMRAENPSAQTGPDDPEAVSVVDPVGNKESSKAARQVVRDMATDVSRTVQRNVLREAGKEEDDDDDTRSERISQAGDDYMLADQKSDLDFGSDGDVDEEEREQHQFRRVNADGGIQEPGTKGTGREQGEGGPVQRHIPTPALTQSQGLGHGTSPKTQAAVVGRLFPLPPLPPDLKFAKLPGLPSNIHSLMYGPEDQVVRPIVGNVKIESAGKPSPLAPLDRPSNYNGDATFEPVSLHKALQLQDDELSRHLTQLYKVIRQRPVTPAGIHALDHLQEISGDVMLANKIINSAVLLALVAAIDDPHAISLVPRACSTIAVLIRHSTYLAPSDGAKSLVHKLVAIAHETTDVHLQRQSMAAFGELIFYITTLKNPEGGGSHPGWSITAEPINRVCGLIGGGKGRGRGRRFDAVASHYFVKAVENVLARPSPHMHLFTSEKLAMSLMQCFKHSTDQSLSSTLCSVFSRLCHRNPALCPLIITELSASKFSRLLTESGLKIQRHLLGILCETIISAPIAVCKAFFGTSSACNHTLVPTVLGIGSKHTKDLAVAAAERPTDATSIPKVRGRAALAYMLLMRVDPNHFIVGCQSPPLLLNFFDTLARDRSVRKHVDLMTNTLRRLIGNVALLVSAEVDAAAKLDPLNLELVQDRLQILAVIAWTLRKTTLTGSLVSTQLMSSVSLVDKAAKALPNESKKAAKSYLLRMTHAISKQTDTIVGLGVDVVKHLMPVLCTFMTGKDNELRFAALRLLYSLCSPILHAGNLEAPEAIVQLKQALTSYILPALLRALGDGPPTSMVVMDLIALLLDQDDPELVDKVHDMGAFIHILSSVAASGQPSIWRNIPVLLLLQRVLERISSSDLTDIARPFLATLDSNLRAIEFEKVDTNEAQKRERLECILDMLNMLLYHHVHPPDSALSDDSLEPLTRTVPCLVGLLRHEVKAVGDKAAYALVVLSTRLGETVVEEIKINTKIITAVLAESDRPALHKRVLKLLRIEPAQLSESAPLRQAILNLVHSEHPDIAALATALLRSR